MLFTNFNAKDFTLIFTNLLTYSISVNFYKTAQLVDCKGIKQNITNIITNLKQIILLKEKKMEFKIHIICQGRNNRRYVIFSKSMHNVISIG